MTWLINRATKSQWSQKLSVFLKFVKRPQKNSRLIPWGNPKLLGQKSQNLSLGQTFLATVFSLQHFIETTMDIDMLMQVKLQFCNNSEFIVISDVIMLFCPLLDNWILCRIGVEGEICGITLLDLVNAQCIMHIVFQLCDIRFDSTVVINVLINVSCPKLNNQVFFNFEA